MSGMKTQRKLALAGLAILLSMGSAHAQAGPPPGSRGDGPFGGIGFGGFESGFRGKVVAASPFTATLSTQFSQTLADGNQIQSTTTGTIARDSQGRTRRDLTFPAIGPWAASGKSAPHIVVITDPVAGVQYLLQPDKKIARKITLPTQRAQNNQPSNATPPPRNGEARTDLGTQTINGVLAQGTRTTRTIPVGAIGNQQPLAIVNERWFSSDLQMMVMTKRSDPRTGQSLFQLTDIQRNEPDATLFQVPSDYTVQDSRMGGPRGPRNHGGPNGPNGGAPPAQD